MIEIKYRERPKSPLITYHLSVDESAGAPVVVHESLAWKRKSHGRPFRFLEYQRGSGQAVSGEVPDEQDERAQIPLSSPDLLAVNALGVCAPERLWDLVVGHCSRPVPQEGPAVGTTIVF